MLQARRYDIAVQWAAILTDEFSNQGDMEKALDMPTCLFGGPPDPDNLVKLGESQIGFISIFALPLFSCISDVLPSMDFTVGELTANIEIWRKRVKGWMEPGGTTGTKGCLMTSDPSQCPVSAAMRQARQASASTSSSSKSSFSSMPLTKSRQRTKMTSATAKGQKDVDIDTDSDNYTEAESQMKDDETEDDEHEDYENEEEEYVSPRSSFGELSPVFPQEAGPASASASASVSPSVSSSTSSTTTTTQKTSRQSSGGALRRAAAAGGTGASMGAPTNDRENGFAFGLPGVSTIPTIAVGAVAAGGLTEASAATPPISSDGAPAATQQARYGQQEYVNRVNTADANAANATNEDDALPSGPATSSSSLSQLTAMNEGRGDNQKKSNDFYPAALPTQQTPTVLSPSSTGMGAGAETVSPDVSPRSTSSHVHAYAQQAHTESNKSDSIVIDNSDIIYDARPGDGNEHVQPVKQYRAEKEKSDRGGSVCNYSYPNPYAAQQGQQQQGNPQRAQSHGQQQQQMHIVNLLSNKPNTTYQPVEGSISPDERGREDFGDSQNQEQGLPPDQDFIVNQNQPQSRSPKVPSSLTPSSLYHQALYGPGGGTVSTPASVPVTARSAALTSHPSVQDSDEQQQQQQQKPPTTPTQQQKRHSHHSSHHKILQRLPSAQDFRPKDGWSGLFSSSTSPARGIDKDRNSRIAPDASAAPLSEAATTRATKTPPNAGNNSYGSIDHEDTRSTKTSSTFFPTSFHNPFASSPFSSFNQFVPHSSSLNDNDNIKSDPILTSSDPNATNLSNSTTPAITPLPPFTPTTTSTTPTRPTTSNTIKTVNTTKTSKTTSTSAGYNNSNGSTKPHKNVLQKKNPHYYPGMAVPLPPSTPTHSTFTAATSTTSTGTSGSGFGFGFGSGIGSGFLNSVRRRQSAPGGSGGGSSAAATAAAAVRNVASEKKDEGRDSGKGGLVVQQKKTKGDKGDVGAGKSSGNGDGSAGAGAGAGAGTGTGTGTGTGGSEDGRISHGRRRFWRRGRAEKVKESKLTSVQ